MNKDLKDFLKVLGGAAAVAGTVIIAHESAKIDARRAEAERQARLRRIDECNELLDEEMQYALGTMSSVDNAKVGVLQDYFKDLQMQKTRQEFNYDFEVKFSAKSRLVKAIVTETDLRELVRLMNQLAPTKPEPVQPTSSSDRWTQVQDRMEIITDKLFSERDYFKKKDLQEEIERLQGQLDVMDPVNPYESHTRWNYLQKRIETMSDKLYAESNYYNKQTIKEIIESLRKQQAKL